MKAKHTCNNFNCCKFTIVLFVLCFARASVTALMKRVYYYYYLPYLGEEGKSRKEERKPNKRHPPVAVKLTVPLYK